MFPRFVIFILLAAACLNQGAYAQYDPQTLGAPVAATKLLETMKSNAAVQRFHQYLYHCGMDELLEGSASYTIFAPADEAMRAMALDEKRKRWLKRWVNTHLVAGHYDASDLLRMLSQGMGHAQLRTLDGSLLELSLEGSDILLTDAQGRKARILLADQKAANGVIHQLSSYFLP